jgi:hypothetical protein
METNTIFEYLDELRTSGETNMFGAAPYLARDFGIAPTEARKLLAEWMRTFSERHPRKDSQA